MTVSFRLARRAHSPGQFLPLARGRFLISQPRGRGESWLVLNPDVRQANVQETICVSGYTATVRPSTTYTNGVKAKLLRELGLPPADAAKYELDHRIPLALGGHPRNPHNLAL